MLFSFLLQVYPLIEVISSFKRFRPWEIPKALAAYVVLVIYSICFYAFPAMCASKPKI